MDVLFLEKSLVLSVLAAGRSDAGEIALDRCL